MSAAVVAGAGPLTPQAAAAPTGSEAVVPAAGRTTDLSASLFAPEQMRGADGAGAKGVFHRMEGFSGLVWTRYADGKTFPVPADVGAIEAAPTGSDLLARRPGGGRVVELWDAVDRTSRTLPVPEGQIHLATYGSTVITHTKTADDPGPDPDTLHLLSPGADGSPHDVTVRGLPEGGVVGPPLGGDESSLFFLGKVAGTSRVFEADMRTGQVKGWSDAVPSGHVFASISPDRVAVYSRYAAEVLVLDRSDLSAAPTTVSLEGGTFQPRDALAVVGDWLLYRPRTGSAAGSVKAAPIAGGDPVTLVGKMNRPAISVGPGGTAVVIGPSGGQQAIQRITADGSGRPVVTVVKPLPRPKAEIRGLALAQGRLLVTDSSSGRRDDYARTVDSPLPGGAPAFGERSSFTPGTNVLIGSDCPAKDVGCSQVHGTTDGRIAWLEHEQADDRIRVNGPGSTDLFEKNVPAGGVITDLSGKYVIHTVDGKQSVYRLGNHAPAVVTRDAGAAALWGDDLWTPGTAPGTVTAYGLTAKKTVEEVSTGADCAPTELQALGRWLYWSCGVDGPAGVYDRTEKRTVAVPGGEALLGDGATEEGGTTRGELAVGWHGAGPDAPLPTGRYDWTLTVRPADGSGPSLETRGTVALRRGTPVRHDHAGAGAEPDGTGDLLTLNSSGGLTFQQGDGKGGFSGKASASGWPAKALAVPFGDLDGDRCNDVLVRMTDGSLRGYRPECGGAPAPSAPYTKLGTGWNAYDVLTSPGDLTGDGRADLLARKASTGDIHVFAAKSDGTLAAGKKIRSAWKSYTKIVGAGDLNGDGIGDVLARHTDGTLYRYEGKGDGTLKDRAKVFTAWGASYNAVIGVGDITGDGKADLVVRDTAGNLYRNDGKGNGSFTGRTKIASGWGGYRGLF
ncbi:FG-GAP repeat domain-containing protein [Streptomyces sp. NPDC018584]|uniref:FG-GAP repeat domain-containing protein n=1 Tax=unclassified Streptomyces TaxID=2593676 RepID=UPI003789ABAC